MVFGRKLYLIDIRRMAPDRCEMCDYPLPTWSARLKHLAATKHCTCPQCDGYLPPGTVYHHWSVMHDDLIWNDHHIASGDRSTLREAQPWVRAEAYKSQGMSAEELDAYLGVTEEMKAEQRELKAEWEKKRLEEVTGDSTEKKEGDEEDNEGAKSSSCKCL